MLFSAATLASEAYKDYLCNLKSMNKGLSLVADPFVTGILRSDIGCCRCHSCRFLLSLFHIIEF